jgi:hypothetical protein
MVKIGNVEHLLHDALLNQLIITSDGHVISAFWSNDINKIRKATSRDISIFIINRSINKYIFYGKEIIYSYLCAIARGDTLIQFDAGESGAEVYHELNNKPYEIYVMPMPMPMHDVEDSWSKLSFIQLYKFPEWTGSDSSNHEFYAIVHYNYCLKNNFIKEIEKLIFKGVSCYISADKKCIFINRYNNNIETVKILACNETNIMPGFTNKFIKGLRRYVINADNAYLPSIKNLSYPGQVILTRGDADIYIMHEYLHINFLKVIYTNNYSEIRIYEFKEYQPNIVSRMMTEVLMDELIETDRTIIINTNYTRICTLPIVFIQKQKQR